MHLTQRTKQALPEHLPALRGQHAVADADKERKFDEVIFVCRNCGMAVYQKKKLVIDKPCEFARRTQDFHSTSCYSLVFKPDSLLCTKGLAYAFFGKPGAAPSPLAGTRSHKCPRVLEHTHISRVHGMSGTEFLSQSLDIFARRCCFLIKLHMSYTNIST